MPKGYTHLAHDKRCQIFALLNRGLKQSEIAKDLDINQSTVSREIERNSGRRGYRHKQANEKANTRRRNASASPRKMTPTVTAYVDRMLQMKQWSPEQISGIVKTAIKIDISAELIYRHIWKNKRNGGDLYKELRRGGKKYNKRGGSNAGRGMIPNRIGIEQRPAIVDRKERVGDFELDTIVGAKHQGAIVSMVDRRTKLTRLFLVSRAGAKETGNAIIQSLEPLKNYVHTLTSDNGKEFSEHAIVAKKLEADFYFANPYCAWERGLNENTNGLVRQYFPKGSDFTTITQEQVKRVECLLNNRPRKTLDFFTPLEVFFQLTGQQLNYALQS